MITRRPAILTLILGAAFALLGGGLASAADVQVAVAANFTEPAKAIAEAFNKATGDKAVLSFGSSGAFAAQITQGAPFEVFLSADAERPAQVEKAGLTVARTRFTYAVGRLVLYSKTPGLVDAKGAVLSSGKFDKIAIADPAAAPYGSAAVQAMTKLGVYEAVKTQIVQGTSITQAFQFVDTGAAEVGFIALSQTVGKTGGSQWLVPARLHTPITQQAVLLKTGEKNPAARKFLDFLKGSQAKAIIKSFGYELK